MTQTDFQHQFPLLFPNYRYEAADFFRFCEKNDLSFSVDAVRAYQLAIPRYLKHGTFNKKLAAAKKVVEDWVSKVNSDEYPATAFMLRSIKGMKKADKSVPSDRWHTPEQIQKLRSIAGKKTDSIVYFLVCSGVRAAEATAITLNDIVPNGEVYSVRIHGKGNKERMIPIPSDVVDQALRVFSGKKFLFETYSRIPYKPDDYSKMIAKTGKRIRLKTSAHRMRHTFATRFLAINPGKFKELSMHMGHSSVQITMDLYAHVEMVINDLIKATGAFKTKE